MNSLQNLIKNYLESDHILTFLNNYDINKLELFKIKLDKCYIKKHIELLYDKLFIPINIDFNEFIMITNSYQEPKTFYNNVITIYKFNNIYCKQVKGDFNNIYYSINYPNINDIISSFDTIHNLNEIKLNWNYDIEYNILYIKLFIIYCFINHKFIDMLELVPIKYTNFEQFKY